MNLSFFSNDWNKIPQNYRFIFIGGGLFIFNSWLLDHWGPDGAKYLKFAGIDVALVGYWVGFFLILIGMGIIVVKQMMFFANILWLRRKYPYSKLNKDFYIYSFDGTWYLFDKQSHEYFHIHPWETVQDLRMEGWEDYLPFKLDPSNMAPIPIGSTGKVLDITKYKNAGKINTRG